MASGTQKVRENLVRRMAERQGYYLRKSRRRDENALDYGQFWLIHEPVGKDNRGGTLVFPTGDSGEQFGASLDEIESFLKSPRPRGRKKAAR